MGEIVCSFSFGFIAFTISCLLCPVIIKICNKKQLFDEVDERKIHTGNVPRLGGVAVFSSVIVTTLCYLFAAKVKLNSSSYYLLASFLIIFITGFLDDIFTIRARIKFLLQMIAAFIVAISPYYFDVLFFIQLPEFLGRMGIFFWILLLINAYNLIDGLDWLCGGLSLITFLTFVFLPVNFLTGTPVNLVIICCALAGFLVWNKPKAKIFLGDSGSTTIGYLIAIIPMLYKETPSFQYNQLLVSLLISSIPTIDVLAAIIRRIREHRSIFAPDRAHLHHKLLNIGFTHKTILITLLGIQAFIGVEVFFMEKSTNKTGTAFLFGGYVIVYGFFIIIHYINRLVNRRHSGKLEDKPQEEY